MAPLFPTLAWHIPSLTQDLVILVVALLIFGKRLPEVARMLGKSIVEFKKGINDVASEVTRAADQPATPAPPPPQVGTVDVKQIPSAAAAAPAQAASAPVAAEAQAAKPS